MSTVSTGKYYKNKTMRLFQDRGFDVVNLERSGSTRWGCRKPKMVRYSTDVWGADFMAKHERSLCFVQVKKGRKRKDGSPVADLSASIREFSKAAPWPPRIKLVVVVWAFRVSVPLEVDVTHDVVHIDHLQAVAKEVQDVD